VVAVGIADRRGDHIGFWGFTRIGAPIALASLIVSSLYLWLRYFAIG
jgi:Na+/H+ antiporter NhaD/arsenite permease-like protein